MNFISSHRCSVLEVLLPPLRLITFSSSISLPSPFLSLSLRLPSLRLYLFVQSSFHISTPSLSLSLSPATTVPLRHYSTYSPILSVTHSLTHSHTYLRTPLTLAPLCFVCVSGPHKLHVDFFLSGSVQGFWLVENKKKKFFFFSVIK